MTFGELVQTGAVCLGYVDSSTDLLIFQVGGRLEKIHLSRKRHTLIWLWTAWLVEVCERQVLVDNCVPANSFVLQLDTRPRPMLMVPDEHGKSRCTFGVPEGTYTLICGTLNSKILEISLRLPIAPMSSARRTLGLNFPVLPTAERKSGQRSDFGGPPLTVYRDNSSYQGI